MITGLNCDKCACLDVCYYKSRLTEAAGKISELTPEWLNLNFDCKYYVKKPTSPIRDPLACQNASYINKYVLEENYGYN